MDKLYHATTFGQRMQITEKIEEEDKNSELSEGEQEEEKEKQQKGVR